MKDHTYSNLFFWWFKKLPSRTSINISRPSSCKSPHFYVLIETPSFTGKPLLWASGVNSENSWNACPSSSFVVKRRVLLLYSGEEQGVRPTGNSIDYDHCPGCLLPAQIDDTAAGQKNGKTRLDPFRTDAFGCCGIFSLDGTCSGSSGAVEKELASLFLFRNRTGDSGMERHMGDRRLQKI
jgi:hypothetical protein